MAKTGLKFDQAQCPRRVIFADSPMSEFGPLTLEKRRQSRHGGTSHGCRYVVKKILRVQAGNIDPESSADAQG
jgi:hypothetical protein